MSRRMMSRGAIGAGVLLVLAGCDGDEQETRFQCAIVDQYEHETAVDCDAVDDATGNVSYGGGLYPVFIHAYPDGRVSSPYTPGSRLPAGGHRVGYKDAAGRQQWGLPPSGRVANNTVKTSVVGKGGTPVSAGKGAGG